MYFMKYYMNLFHNDNMPIMIKCVCVRRKCWERIIHFMQCKRFCYIWSNSHIIYSVIKIYCVLCKYHMRNENPLSSDDVSYSVMLIVYINMMISPFIKKCMQLTINMQFEMLFHFFKFCCCFYLHLIYFIYLDHESSYC